MESDQTRHLLRIEMEAHSILKCNLQFVDRFSLSMNRVSQSPGYEAAFRRLFNDKNNLAIVVRTIHAQILTFTMVPHGGFPTLDPSEPTIIQGRRTGVQL